MCMSKICDFFVCFTATHSWFTYKLVYTVLCNFSCCCRIVLVTIFPCFTETEVCFLTLMLSYLCVCIEKIKPIVATSYAFFWLMQVHMNPTASESTILALRQSPSPYQLCQFILGRFTLASSEVILYLSRFHYFLAWFNYNESHV